MLQVACGEGLRPSGFEPLTYRLEGGCSIQLSYGRLCLVRNRICARRRGIIPREADSCKWRLVRPIRREFGMAARQRPVDWADSELQSTATKKVQRQMRCAV
ncbi:MAG: hypothetical protein RIT02_1334 [Planctomycetota bacterium]